MAELTTNKNFLQPTGFRVVINRQDYPNLEFFAQSVTHPGSSVPPAETAVPRLVAGLPVPGSKISYSDLTLQLILDEDMVAYKEMQQWLERSLDNHDIHNDITVVILTSHNNKNVEIRYRNCLPTDVGSIELNSTLGDTVFITFDATFRFTSFEII